MRNKTLLLGTLALGLAALLTVALRREAPTDQPAKSPLVPVAILDGLRTVSLRVGPKAATIEKSNAGEWQVKERFGLPADVENRLTPLLRSLQSAQNFGLLTANPKRLEKLELGGSVVTLTAADGQTFALGLGKTTDDGLGSAARLQGETKAVRTSFTGYVEGAPSAWIDPVLFTTKAEEVRELALTFPDGSTSFSRPAKDRPFTAKDPTPLSDLAAALATLRITDAVAKGDADATAAFAKSWSVKLALFDGSAVTMTFAKGAAKSPEEPGRLYVRAAHSDPKHRLNQLAAKAEFIAPPWLAEQVKPTLAEFNRSLNPPADPAVPTPPTAK